MIGGRSWKITTSWPSHSLTTYYQPVNRMIDATVNLIEDIAIGAEPDTVGVQIKGDIIIRKSTRPPARGVNRNDQVRPAYRALE